MGKSRLPLPAIRALQRPKRSQGKVAKAAGMAYWRYWQIESGEGVEPTKDEREAVAAALGVKVSAIAWPEREAVKVKAS